MVSLIKIKSTTPPKPESLAMDWHIPKTSGILENSLFFTLSDSTIEVLNWYASITPVAWFDQRTMRPKKKYSGDFTITLLLSHKPKLPVSIYASYYDTYLRAFAQQSVLVDTIKPVLTHDQKTEAACEPEINQSTRTYQRVPEPLYRYPGFLYNSDTYFILIACSMNILTTHATQTTLHSLSIIHTISASLTALMAAYSIMHGLINLPFLCTYLLIIFCTIQWTLQLIQLRSSSTTLDNDKLQKVAAIIPPYCLALLCMPKPAYPWFILSSALISPITRYMHTKLNKNPDYQVTQKISLATYWLLLLLAILIYHLHDLQTLFISINGIIVGYQLLYSSKAFTYDSPKNLYMKRFGNLFIIISLLVIGLTLINSNLSLFSLIPLSCINTLTFFFD